MKKYEELEKLQESILKAGFFQVGERVVVQELPSGQYRVLEGNRRVCALKDLHGLYGNPISENNRLIEQTKEIDVDLIVDEDDIQPFLSIRHIDGVRKWSAESRRNFYFKHFENDKTVNQIEQMTQQSKAEIKKFIRELLFLNYFKAIVSTTDIDTPSLIYERIYRYSVELNLIKDIEINNESIYSETRIIVQTNILTELELHEFYKEIYMATFNEDKEMRLINSRSINKLEDFKTYLCSTNVKEKYPKLTLLMEKIILNNKLDGFIPLQKINESIEGNVPKINEIIEYDLIKDTAIIKIFDGDHEIDAKDFINSSPGMYDIIVNGHKFNFKIKPFVQPIIIAPDNIQFYLGTKFKLRDEIQIYDFQEKRHGLDNKYVDISLSNDLRLNGDELSATIAGEHEIEIKYNYTTKEGKKYFASKSINVVVEPHIPSGYKIQTNNGFFKFRVIKFNKATSYLTTAKLFDELDNAYKQGRNHIFIAALRSLLDLYILEFLSRSKNIANGNIWSSCSSEGCVRDKFMNLPVTDISKICSKYVREMKVKYNRDLDFHKIRNYFESNITRSDLTKLMGTLHLGAHTSLHALFSTNIEAIQPTFNAWIEFLFVIEEIQYIW
jgi:hypothetical protein